MEFLRKKIHFKEGRMQYPKTLITREILMEIKNSHFNP